MTRARDLKEGDRFKVAAFGEPYSGGSRTARSVKVYSRDPDMIAINTGSKVILLHQDVEVIVKGKEGAGALSDVGAREGLLMATECRCRNHLGGAKQQHASRDAAITQLVRHHLWRGEHGVYQCPTSKAWHVTSRPR